MTTSEYAAQAQLAYEKGNFATAADLYKKAADEALHCGDTLTSAEMNNNCCVALLKSGDAPSAYKAVHGSDAIFATAGDFQRQALALGNLGAVHEALGNNEQAIAAYQMSADLLAKTGDQEARGIVLKSLSALQSKMGKHLQAIVSMQEALNCQKHLSPQEQALKKLLHHSLRMLK